MVAEKDKIAEAIDNSFFSNSLFNKDCKNGPPVAEGSTVSRKLNGEREDSTRRLTKDDSHYDDRFWQLGISAECKQFISKKLHGYYDQSIKYVEKKPKFVRLKEKSLDSGCRLSNNQSGDVLQPQTDVGIRIFRRHQLVTSSSDLTRVEPKRRKPQKRSYPKLSRSEIAEAAVSADWVLNKKGVYD